MNLNKDPLKLFFINIQLITIISYKENKGKHINTVESKKLEGEKTYCGIV